MVHSPKETERKLNRLQNNTFTRSEEIEEEAKNITSQKLEGILPIFPKQVEIAIK